MEGNILVSVIMPAYNSQNYITQAIKSVLEQKVSLELIIINDCSTDETDAIIKSFLIADTRIKYLINDRNVGVAASRNRGIKKAIGKYIAFLDSDDYWDCDKLYVQANIMEKEQLVFSCTARELVDADGKSKEKIISVDEKITYQKLLKNNQISCSSVLIRTDVMKRHLMGNDHIHEDYVCWLSILKEVKFCYGIKEPYLKYRVTLSGKSGNKLNSAKMMFMSYRYLGYNNFMTVYYFCCYAFNGIRKYFFTDKTDREIIKVK